MHTAVASSSTPKAVGSSSGSVPEPMGVVAKPFEPKSAVQPLVHLHLRIAGGASTVVADFKVETPKSLPGISKKRRTYSAKEKVAAVAAVRLRPNDGLVI